MEIIDISWPITSQMTTYKDKHDVQIASVKKFDQDGVRESRLCLGSHTGTHVDAPAHFLEQGSTIESIFLEELIGSCQVIDMLHIEDKITASDLAQISLTTSILLFKTKNSFLSCIAPFDANFVYIDASAATYLLTKFPTLKVIGFDYLGIERNQPAHLTHTSLFEQGVIIVEGLRLAHVQAGIYQFVCLPLALRETEAAPARAVLMREK